MYKIVATKTALFLMLSFCQISLASSSCNKIAQHLPQMIFPEDTVQKLQQVIASTKKTKEKKGNFSSILLSGPSDKDKSMFAKMIARDCNMHYLPISHLFFYQSQKKAGKGITAIKNLFQSASSNQKLFNLLTNVLCRHTSETNEGMILFIDEAEDIFLKKQRNFIE